MSGAMTAYVNARLIDPAAGYDGPGGVLVEGEMITASGAEVTAGAAPAEAEVIDCGGRMLAPGLIDMLVATGEPGAEHKETLKSASEAAAAGGVTQIIVTPNTDPVIDDVSLVDFVLRRARDTGVVRVAPMAAITKGLAGAEMTEFGLLKEAGALAFSDGTKAVADSGLMRRALSYARAFDAVICAYAEDASLSGDGCMNEGELSSRLGLAGAPAAAEEIGLDRDLALVRLTGGRYHAASISCAGSLAALEAAKAEGLAVTCGASINNLVLNENDIGDYRTFFKLQPPLRREEDRLALADGVARGAVDIITSAHTPQPPEDKRRPFAEAAYGAVGVETLLPAALRLYHSGDVSLLRLMDAMSRAPADLLGLAGGRLSPGAPADLIIADIDAPFVLQLSDLRSRSRNSPFEDQRLQGRVWRTIVGGRMVFQAE